MPKKYTMEFVLEFIEDKPFECLETEYHYNKTLMRWKCKVCSHIWEACFSSIKNQGSGCPACANNINFKIEQVRDMGLEKGYILISTEYENAAQILEWICSEKHQYFSTLANLRDHRGRGCAKCAGLAPVDIEELKQVAIDRAGKLVSKECKNNRDKLEWECGLKHRWFACSNNIKDSGTWCPTCNGNIPLTEDEFHQLAKKNSGKLISKYEGLYKKVEWECKERHRWCAIPFSIKYTKTWCPECASFKSERLIRESLEYMTGSKWIKCRPVWLGKLELDGYCESENIAFEYQGRQHYEYIPYFHKSEQDFKNQQKRDKRKKEILKSRDIELIEIPYTYDHKTPIEKISNYLELELLKIYIKRKQKFFTEEYDITKYKDYRISYIKSSDNKRYSLSISGFIKKLESTLDI